MKILSHRGSCKTESGKNTLQSFEYVWIDAECSFKKGLKIGDGAVVSAESAVTHDVEPYTVVGGIPARCIQIRFGAWLAEFIRNAREE